MCGEIGDSHQFYMGTQLFIHHNLVQNKILTLFMCLPYYGTNTLHDNIFIFYLRPLMYGKMGGEHPYL